MSRVVHQRAAEIHPAERTPMGRSPAYPNQGRT